MYFLYQGGLYVLPDTCSLYKEQGVPYIRQMPGHIDSTRASSSIFTKDKIFIKASVLKYGGKCFGTINIC